MDCHKDMNVNKFKIPTIKHFFQGGRCEIFKGVIYVVYWWWMQRNGRENKEVRAMPTCYCLTFMCCKPCFSNFHCFQSCVSWTTYCIFSFCYFSYAVVSGTCPWVAVS